MRALHELDADSPQGGVNEFLETKYLQTALCPEGYYNELGSLIQVCLQSWSLIPCSFIFKPDCITLKLSLVYYCLCVTYKKKSVIVFGGVFTTDWQVNGHEAVTLLFSSGAYNMFHAKTVAIFGVVYGVLAAITAGLSVPAGIFVPSMTIGACLGRLLAIFTNTYVKLPLGIPPIDPGPWATIGAAAFLCGSARITVTIAIIILEITGDFRYIPGIAIAVVFAKLTGGFFTKSKWWCSLVQRVFFASSCSWCYRNAARKYRPISLWFSFLFHD